MEATFLETKLLKSAHVSQHKDVTLADFTRSQRLRRHLSPPTRRQRSQRQHGHGVSVVNDYAQSHFKVAFVL